MKEREQRKVKHILQIDRGRIEEVVTTANVIEHIRMMSISFDQIVDNLNIIPRSY